MPVAAAPSLTTFPAAPTRRDRETASWLQTALAAVTLVVLGTVGAFSHHAPSHADGVVPNSRAAGMVPSRNEANPEWRQLTPAQRQVLTPLQGHWHELDDVSRDKWVGVAERYPRLSPDEQARVRERMAQWSNLPSSERGDARLRFQQSRQLTADERQKKWDAYQALPPDDREALQRQAQRQAKPVFLSDNMVGPREPRQAFANKRNPATTQLVRKSNLVPGPSLAGAATPAAVAPAVVKAGTGATTTLVTQRPTPPLHQQSGLPKIAATQGFVDPVTLLPQRGAQGAGMTPTNAAASSPR